MKKSLKDAFPKTLPVMAGYIFLGIAYGVSMKEMGFGWEWSLLISAVVYGGSMQFAMIGLMTAPFAPVTALLMTLMVQARHLFYGLSMLGHYHDTGKAKPYLVFALTDETYSLVCNGAPEDVNPQQWYTAVSALDQLYWVIGSVLGALLGQVLPFDLTGIDFAMTALFTVIVTEQTRGAVKAVKAGTMSKQDAWFPAVLGFGATLVSLLLVGKSSFLLVSMAVMMAFFFLRYQGVKEAVKA